MEASKASKRNVKEMDLVPEAFYIGVDVDGNARKALNNTPRVLSAWNLFLLIFGRRMLLLQELGLIDINLSDRLYTWSNEINSPPMARLDRFMASWLKIFPTVTPLPNTSSADDNISDFGLLDLSRPSMFCRPRVHGLIKLQLANGTSGPCLSPRTYGSTDKENSEN